MSAHCIIHWCVCTGVEGGFQVDEKKFVFEEELSVVVLPQWHEVKLPNLDLPEVVSHCAYAAVLSQLQFSTIFKNKLMWSHTPCINYQPVFFTSLLELVTHYIYKPPKLTDNNLCTVNTQKEGNLVATMVSGTLALIAQGLAPQTAGHRTLAHAAEWLAPQTAGHRNTGPHSMMVSMSDCRSQNNGPRSIVVSTSDCRSQNICPRSIVVSTSDSRSQNNGPRSMEVSMSDRRSQEHWPSYHSG